MKKQNLKTKETKKKKRGPVRVDKRKSGAEQNIKQVATEQIGTAHTATRARQTGVTVAKLEDEQHRESLQALATARKRYKAEGHPDSCGDLIATALEVFKTKDGLDIDGLTGCLEENELQAPKVDLQRHGATGRFRMCAGLMLRRRGRQVGFVVIGGKRIPVQQG